MVSELFVHQGLDALRDISMIRAHSCQHISRQRAKCEGLDAECQKLMICMDLHSHSIEMTKHLVTQGMFTDKVFESSIDALTDAAMLKCSKRPSVHSAH
jgi:hypothetical protein